MNNARDRAVVRWGLLLIVACLAAMIGASAGVIVLAVLGTPLSGLAWLFGVIGGTTVAIVVISLRLRTLERRRIEALGLGRPAPRYSYTAGTTYDEALAVKAAARARTRTSAGQPYRQDRDA